MGERQLVVAVETTQALQASWPLLLAEYVEKIVRAFAQESGTQENASTPAMMSIIAFIGHDKYADTKIQQSTWVSNVDVFLGWLKSLKFSGGDNNNEAAVAEALAQALQIRCPGPELAAVPEQKHCLLIAASNPYCMLTLVRRPPVLLNANGQLEYWTGQTERLWLADAAAVSKAFPPCQVSLSVIGPKQWRTLRSLYTGALRNPEAAENGARINVQYPQHLILISEDFPEGKEAIHGVTVAAPVEDTAPAGIVVTAGESTVASTSSPTEEAN